MAIVLEILKHLAEFITSFIAHLGYAGIFSLMILESALIPIPSEIIMPFSGFLSSTSKLDPFLVTLSGSLGNLIGSLLTYYLGIKAGRKFIQEIRGENFLCGTFVTWNKNVRFAPCRNR